MSEKELNQNDFEDIPEGIAKTKSPLSIVWLIPVVALLVGIWLAYKAWSEMGPTITISFNTSEGLEAGKTKIKFKDVEIGHVESIALSDDTTHVNLTAEMISGAEKYLNEKTRFWVVRAHISAGQISGLGTLLSGAYIGIDPGDGKSGRIRKFKGLETQPVVTHDLGGKQFILNAKSLGSIDIGLPVYYRQIKVGQVISRRLSEDGESVQIEVFVNAPYEQWVNKYTRFWNASGLNVSVNASGITVDTESIVALMVGGIAFETPERYAAQPPIKANHQFTLFKNKQAVADDIYTLKSNYVLYFSQSVRGLSVGAPVEIKGIRIGKVTGIEMEFDPKTQNFAIPVNISLEPGRFKMKGLTNREEFLHKNRRKVVNQFVSKGLRAQLGIGSFVTGQLFIDLVFNPEAKPVEIIWDNDPPVFPTMPTPLEEITTSVASIVKKIEKIPMDKIGEQLQYTLIALTETLENTKQLTGNLNTSLIPEVHIVLERTATTLTSIENMVDSESPINQELQQALEAVTQAAQSVRIMADYLERHPDALIYGKGERK